MVLPGNDSRSGSMIQVADSGNDTTRYYYLSTVWNTNPFITRWSYNRLIIGKVGDKTTIYIVIIFMLPHTVLDIFETRRNQTGSLVLRLRRENEASTQLLYR